MKREEVLKKVALITAIVLFSIHSYSDDTVRLLRGTNNQCQLAVPTEDGYKGPLMADLFRVWNASPQLIERLYGQYAIHQYIKAGMDPDVRIPLRWQNCYMMDHAQRLLSNHYDRQNVDAPVVADEETTSQNSNPSILQ